MILAEKKIFNKKSIIKKMRKFNETKKNLDSRLEDATQEEITATGRIFNVDNFVIIIIFEKLSLL